MWAVEAAFDVAAYKSLFHLVCYDSIKRKLGNILIQILGIKLISGGLFVG